MKLILLLGVLVGLTCGNGEDVTFFPNTRTADKPGECPKSPSLALEVCSAKCKSDSECDGVRKCCETSCKGFTCQIPDQKPGSCPPYTSDTTCDPKNRCTSDSKCDGEQKCCPNSCNGSACQNPV